jgi:hypothetical protein
MIDHPKSILINETALRAAVKLFKLRLPVAPNNLDFVCMTALYVAKIFMLLTCKLSA